jgi:predicted nucleic acid-binding Zn ribbon protein
MNFSIRSRNEEAIDALEDTPFTENEKTSMSKLEVKAMMIIFFDITGLIMIEWVPEGQTVNQKYCVEVLTKLRGRMRKKSPEL